MYCLARPPKCSTSSPSKTPFGNSSPLTKITVLLAVALQIQCSFAAPLPASTPLGCPMANSTLDTPIKSIVTNTGSSKTIYIMPLGSLTDRLASIASAYTHARTSNVDLVVVWPDSDADFAASWTDLYQSPILPLGPFPSGRYSHADPGCTVHRISSYNDYVNAHKAWEKLPSGKSVLCLVSSSDFAATQRDNAWFYPLLKPSDQVLAIETPFMELHHWERWGQWVGIHACRTQECVRTAAQTGTSMPQTSDYLSMAGYFAAMPLDGESVPRFFIVSEDPTEEQLIMEEVWGMNLTGIKGAGVVFPTTYRKKHPNSVAGLRETVAQLDLMSKTSLIIGAPGSAFSHAAAMAGKVYMVYADAKNTVLHHGSGAMRAAVDGGQQSVVTAQSRYMAKMG